MALQAIRYTRGSLELLDQRLLPHTFTYLQVDGPQAAWQQIRDMVVRGAPAIGVTGVLALAVDLVANKNSGSAFADADAAVAYIMQTLDYLVTSRPTAVNLAQGADTMRLVARAAQQAAGATAASVVAAVITAAEAYFADDLTANKALGAFGAAALLSAAQASPRGVRASGGLRVLTHCNTGSLATAGYGTALGIIRALHEQGRLEHVYCTETRPYNQGARLTAFELVHDGLPATLVCDSATAYLMSLGQVDAVVVGADRVVANGDTANKVGTYMLALGAQQHGVPFFVAAPTTTLDATLADGSAIEIEQRPAEEMTHFKGTRVVTENIQVWNPCFDITPGTHVTGIITEKGLVGKSGSSHLVAQFVAGLAGKAAVEGADTTPRAALTPPAGFSALTVDSLAAYISTKPELLSRIGPPGPDGYRVREVGDGNINFVYIVEAPHAGTALVVKQSLPFVRCVGEAWPLTQDRLRIEAAALQEEGRCCPAHVPEVYLYDPVMATLAMRFIAPPAIILRAGLIQGRRYPSLAAHVATFLAQTLFRTSLLALPSAAHKAKVAQFSNPEMCALTEQVIFQEPYVLAANNRHTSPQLDEDVAALQADVAAKVAITQLRQKFMTTPQALLHGDLHTGSLMVTETETQVIDPEFAFYGPIAFDVAKILGNLLLALVASPGLEAHCQEPAGSRQPQREWLAETISGIWQGFAAEFLALWNSEAAATGDATPAALTGPGVPAGPEALSSYQAVWFKDVWHDVVAFMGAFMIRRVVGIAHVADLDTIADVDVRARCERRALTLGRSFLTQPQAFADIASIVAAATAATA